MTDNLWLYNKVRSVPDAAKKTISAGRLKGFTDINPQFRIQQLTEQFGPCGIGWKYVITKQWLEPGADGVISAFCNIELYYKHDGEWSEPVPGTGGSAYVASERSGLYTSDEAYKMALTDAISVACKAIGGCADVYWENGRSKYTTNPEPSPEPNPPQKPNGAPDSEALATPEQIKCLHAEMDDYQCEAICMKYNVADVSGLTRNNASKILAQLRARARKEKANG